MKLMKSIMNIYSKEEKSFFKLILYNAVLCGFTPFTIDMIDLHIVNLPEITLTIVFGIILFSFGFFARPHIEAMVKSKKDDV